jgi:hypothetical protein
MTFTPCFGQPTKSHWSLWSVNGKTFPGLCHASVALPDQGPPDDMRSGTTASLVNLFPPVTSYSGTAWSRHPIPIALGEVSKLCQIDGSAGVGDSESVGETGRISVVGFAATNSEPFPTTTVVSGIAVRELVHEVPTLLKTPIRYPAFEFLRPSVVIRRRPQRPNPSGSA